MLQRLLFKLEDKEKVSTSKPSIAQNGENTQSAQSNDAETLSVGKDSDFFFFPPNNPLMQALQNEKIWKVFEKSRTFAGSKIRYSLA